MVRKLEKICTSHRPLHMLWEELYGIFMESTEVFNQQTESCRREHQQVHKFLKEVISSVCG